MRLADFPAGHTIFLDSNCLIYHFTGTFESCALILERAARRELHAVTSAIVLTEVHHRLMLLEAVQELPRRPRNLPAFLKAHPEIIRRSQRCEDAFSKLQAFRLRVLPITRRLAFEAQRISHELGLLTNDALITATMRAHHLTHLASNDTDFARVPDLILWRP